MERPLTVYQADPNETYAATSLRSRDVAAFVGRYKFPILLVFALSVLGTYTTLSLLTDQYDTQAAVLVKLGRENVDPPPTARNTNVFSGIRREEVLSEVEMMKSPDLTERLVKEIGLDAFRVKRVKPASLLGQVKFYLKAAARTVKEQYGEALIALALKKRLTEEERAVEEVSNALSVAYQKDSDVVSLKLRMADPNLARRLLSKLLDLYMLRRIELRQTGGAGQFLAQEAATLRQRLDAIEAEKAGWKANRQLSSAQDQKVLLLRQIRDVTAERDGTVRESRAITRQMEVTGRLLTEAPERLKASEQQTPDPVLESLRQRLTVLEAERAHLVGKFQIGSGQVQNVDEEIRRLRTLVQKANAIQVGSITYQVNPLRQELERKAQEGNIAQQGLEARAVLQSKQLEALRLELSNVDQANSRLEKIERERQIAEANYLAVVKRMQEAEISGQLDRSLISNVSVLTPPTSSPGPVYPRKMLLMGVSILVGLALGIGLSMLMNYLDDRAHDPETVERLTQVPFLGLVEASPEHAGPRS